MRGVVVISLWLVAACSEQHSVDRDGCTRLRDHVVDLRLADSSNELGADAAQHRAAMKQALGDGFIDNCVQTMSYEQLDCSLKLTSLGDSARCAPSAVASH